MGHYVEKEERWKLLSAVFLWSPTQYLEIVAKCPHHSVELEPGAWTDDLTHEGRPRNPRLVYCIGRNILLIQQFLICPFHQHQFLSAQTEILTHFLNLLRMHCSLLNCTTGSYIILKRLVTFRCQLSKSKRINCQQ